MARDFDGTDDEIDFGSDASIDGFTTISYAEWIVVDDLSTNRWLAGKDFSGWGSFIRTTGKPAIDRDWSTDPGEWQTTTDTKTAGSLAHFAITYDGGSTANDPVIYIDGSSVSVTEDTTPVGTLDSDAGANLKIGENNINTADLDGQIQCFAYANAIWSAAEVNRHMWWGVTPGGPSTVEVWHPLFTSDLNNKGTATADGTATGTTMASLPRVERMWGSCMGVGR